MARSVVGLGAVVVSAIALPIACFFPDYTFNQAGGDGGTGAGGPASGGGSPGPGGGSTTMSSANGAMGAEGGGGAGAEGGGGSGALGGGGAGALGGGGSGGVPVGGGGIGGMGGMCMGGPEDCDNGMDDDCDGDIDCQDSDCGNFSCVDNVPVGWTGHYSLYDGMAAGAPGCGGAYPNSFYVGNATLNAPAATCSACTCGAPMNQVCSPPTEMNTQDATCGGSVFCIGQLALGPANGSCTAFNLFNGDFICGPGCPAGSTACNQSIAAGSAFVTGGSCNPSNQVPMVVPPSWGKLGRACNGAVTTAGGCGGGQKCMPDTAAPFESSVCISKVGLNACPAGSYNEQHVFYATFADTRTCTGCGCGTPSGGTCAVTITAYSNGTCTNPAVATFDDGQCVNIAGNPTVWGRKVDVKNPPAGGTCTTSGGTPAGVATPQTPVTFCCIP